MPIELTPITSADADGYYAKRAMVIPTAGADNFEIEGDLNSDGGTDEDSLQLLFDDTDGYVDMVAAEVGIAPADASHYVATSNRHFVALSTAASERVRAKIHRMRGTTSEQTDGPEGQMTNMLERAEENILRTLRVIATAAAAVTATETGIDGITVVEPECACYPTGIGVIL